MSADVDLQAERALLGAAVVSREARDLASDRLSPAAFHDPRHAHLFRALKELSEEGAPSDPVTVTDNLDRLGLLDSVGGAGFVGDLVADAPTRDRASVERWVSIIEARYALRTLAGVSVEINELANSGGDASAAIERAEQLLGEINRPSSGDLLSAAELVAEHAERIERARAGEVDEGISSGLPELDSILGGLVDGRMYVVAGRPGMGKTSLGYLFALSGAIDEGRPVLVVSLEMRGSEVTERMIAGRGRIDSGNLKTGALTPAEASQLDQVTKTLADAPIYVLDSSAATLPAIRAAARKIKSMHGDLGLVIIDYLQLMSSTNRSDSRQQEVSEISRGCKILARDMDIPVVALSQLSRNVEARQDKRPMLSDLRESGAIEQDADVVLFVYRDEHYNPVTDEPGIAELIVAKNRQGAAGVTVKARWLSNFVAFAPLEGPSLSPTVRPVGASSTPGGVPEEF